jgi:molybdopterin synthase catalytic subunit
MSPVQIELRDTLFDSFQELFEYRKTLSKTDDRGACSTFVGTMREYNEGDRVRAMHLEHYPGMTENQLAQIVREACQTHEVLNGILLHRIGKVCPGEDIVLVSVWSTHRKDSFAACREIMEALKSTAPFWKKETLAEGDRWVRNNTPGE